MPPQLSRAARWVAVLICVPFTPLAAAQPNVELRVSDDQAFVGEPISVQIIVENAKTIDPPAFPTLPNCAVQDVGRSSNFSFVNGDVSQSMTYSYRLEPQKAGELVIPPITLQLDGQKVQTRKQVIKVKEGRDRPTVGTGSDGEALLLAEARTNAERLYVGQHAPFTLTIWIRVPGGLGARLDASDMYGLLRNNRTGFGPFPEPQTAERRVLNLPDGKAEYFEYKTRAEVFLDRPGPVSFENLAVVMDYPTRLSREPLFGRLRVAAHETLAIRPEVVAPDVQPLPTNGRPDGFTEAVGQFNINVYASAEEMNVGDPIRLDIEIKGDGPLETLPGPRLETQPRLTEDFRVPSEILTGRSGPGRRVFSATIRAKRPDVTEIPPIEYAYFDPQAGRYEIARSRPIPIEVRTSETASVSDLLNLSSGEPAARIEALDGLAGIKTLESELLSTTSPVTLPQAVAALVAPPAIFLSLWGGMALVSIRNADPARRRRQRAYARAVSRIEASRGKPSEIAAALAGYLADRRNEPPGRFTGLAALELLREQNAAAETIEACTAVLDGCEAAAYGGAQFDGTLRDAALDLLRRLEREPL